MNTNAFDISKANDCNDSQIQSWWVDIPNSTGYLSVVKPQSFRPMIIIGGKGSGKTHLLRYISLPTQAIRHVNVAGILSEGYLGIFVRCNGLNAGRFNHSDLSEREARQWDEAFHYSFDLWLTHSLLHQMQTYLCLPDPAPESEFKSLSGGLFTGDGPNGKISPKNIAELAKEINDIKISVDHSVDNWPFEQRHTFKILSTRGSLVWEVARLLENCYPSLKGITFCYVLDELENLTERQQKYIQTLIRERENPVTFRVGARRYGIRTYETFSAGEANKRGSEFDELILDEAFRKSGNYPIFIGNVLSRRLYGDENPKSLSEILRLNCAAVKQDRDELLLGLTEKYVEASRPPPWLQRFFNVAVDPSMGQYGDNGEEIKRRMTKGMEVIRDPLRQIAILHLLYQDLESAVDPTPFIEEMVAAIEVPDHDGLDQRVKGNLKHFKADHFAKALRMLRFTRVEQELYAPLDAPTLIRMSAGLPRVALVILKNISTMAIFNGERPFEGGNLISGESQWLGLAQTAKWFMEDAPIGLESPATARRAVSRLGELLKGYRYSDKPVECSAISFSYIPDHISPAAKRCIIDCVNAMLLLWEEDRKDRNEHKLRERCMINPVICPLWDLPISSRGSIDNMPPELIESIFDPNTSDEEFAKNRDQFLSRYNYPFRPPNQSSKAWKQARSDKAKEPNSGEQQKLF